MPSYGVALIPHHGDLLDGASHSSACLPQAGISGALYLSVFEQTAKMICFSAQADHGGLPLSD